MQDQVYRFRLKGLNAAYVGVKEFDGVMNGDVQLVSLSPLANRLARDVQDTFLY